MNYTENKCFTCGIKSINKYCKNHSRDPFQIYFNENYSWRSFPYKGKETCYENLPSNMQALIFTTALADFRREQKAKILAASREENNAIT